MIVMATRGGCRGGCGKSETVMGSGQLSTRRSLFQRPTPAAIDFFTATRKIRALCRHIRMRFTKWKENVGNSVTTSGVKNLRIYKVWDVLVKEMTRYVRMNVFK